MVPDILYRHFRFHHLLLSSDPHVFALSSFLPVFLTVRVNSARSISNAWWV